MKLTLDQLKKAIPACKNHAQWLEPLNDVFEKFEINTSLRVAHFLAQITHESMDLNTLQENLNYSAKGLQTTFKKYFANFEYAKQFERKPELIANYVYGNRLGNGDIKTGDGYKYRGRGILQITGKSNYVTMSKDLGFDGTAFPDKLLEPQYAALTAGVFWRNNSINKLADKDDVVAVTKKVNGGTIGLDDRKARLERIKLAIV
jgi:putative chitinase